MSFELNNIIRPHIKHLEGVDPILSREICPDKIYLDANENNYGSPLPDNFNRYPDTLQIAVKEKLMSIKGVPIENIFLGNGSDDVIDILLRIFCEPKIDYIIIAPPTYSMYQFYANINNVLIQEVLLMRNFQLNLEKMIQAIGAHTKLIVICSPNNPTGNSIHTADIETLLRDFHGIVVVDEAYINYARQKSLIYLLAKYPNLVVLQTLSKAWGLAGLRLGMAFAARGIIDIMNKIKSPYNINGVSLQLAAEALTKVDQVNHWVRETVQERQKLVNHLSSLPFILAVYPSDANFLLVKMDDARGVYQHLMKNGIVVRDRSNLPLCEGTLRISIGTPVENAQLIHSLNTYKRT